MSERTASEIRAMLDRIAETNSVNTYLGQFLAHDVSRLLDAAVKLRAALSYRIMRAGTPEQLREAEDALMADTAWLEEDR